MKKLVLLLVAVYIYSGSVFAQSEIQSATLQQGNKTSIFYGVNAFVDALNAVADSADVITLSSGKFKSINLQKAVTIYGAGYEVDVEKGIYPTIIDDFRILHGSEIDGDGNTQTKKGDLDGIYIEGCAINDLKIGNVDLGPVELSNLIIKRCKFGDRLDFDENGRAGSYRGGSSSTKNTQIINCVISNYFYVDRNSDNFSVYNSIINKVFGQDSPNNLLIKNSLLFQMFGVVGTFKDNIILNTNDISGNSSTSYFENNICRHSTIFNNTPQNYNNWIGKNDLSIFGMEVGNEYKSNLTYAIKPDASESFIGTDDTPVGLYGGIAPFTKVPSNPQIISKEIDAKSTPDGKLKVSIKVEAQK